VSATTRATVSTGTCGLPGLGVSRAADPQGRPRQTLLRQTIVRLTSTSVAACCTGPIQCGQQHADCLCHTHTLADCNRDVGVARPVDRRHRARDQEPAELCAAVNGSLGTIHLVGRRGALTTGNYACLPTQGRIRHWSAALPRDLATIYLPFEPVDCAATMRSNITTAETIHFSRGEAP
jgi:hypothetical protein